MDKKKYIIIAVICTMLCMPVAVFQWYCYSAFIKNENTPNKSKLEKWLQIGMVVIFIEMTCICFALYQYGRQLIHVLGTFY